MIRKFRLINGEGVSWDLNARTSFLHSIGGFGYKDGTQYEQIGTDFIPMEELFSQGVMTGRIFFGGRNAYVNYRAFSRFVRAVPLTLVYEMEEAFRVPVRMTEIAKSELITGGAGLDCEVAFTATGLFYKNVSGYTGYALERTVPDKEDAIATAPPAALGGYTFVGWRQDSSAEKKVLSEYIISGEEPVTLYAVFKKQMTIRMMPVCEKYMLTIREASVYSNIGIKKMRRLAEDNTGRFAVFSGNRYLIIRTKFEKFVEECSAL